MPIKIEVTGDTPDDATAAVVMLGKALLNNAWTMPLEDLLAATRTRFKEAGYGVEVNQFDALPPLPEEDKPTPAEAGAIVEKIETKLKKKTTAKKPADVAAALAAADKTFVVDEMVKRFGDPRQKLKAKAFIDVVTGRHGGVRLSLLDAELFPDIRAEMEAEFGIPKTSNGSGSDAHA